MSKYFNNEKNTNKNELYKKIFEMYDTNKDNTMDFFELKEVLSHLGEYKTDSDIIDIMKEYKKGNDINKECLNFEEFCNVINSNTKDKKLFKYIEKSFDWTFQENIITKKDIYNILNENITKKDNIEELMSSLDFDNNDELNTDELIEFIQNNL